MRGKSLLSLSPHEKNEFAPLFSHTLRAINLFYWTLFLRVDLQSTLQAANAICDYWECSSNCNQPLGFGWQHIIL